MVMREAPASTSPARLVPSIQRCDSFWAVAERESPGLEVINFGVSSYGTAQELLTLREKVWAFNPDLVLLAFCTTNDVSDNLRALRLKHDIPYFVRKDGKLQLDDSFLSQPGFRAGLSPPNRAFTWLSRHLRVLRQAGLVEEASLDSDARVRVYRLRREPFVGLREWLDEVEGFWTDQLASFKRHAEAKARRPRA